MYRKYIFRITTVDDVRKKLFILIYYVELEFKYIGHKIEIICLNTIHHIQLSFQRAFFKEMRLKQNPSPNI